ncbi:hypothetical protein B1H29_17655 [Streptomyces pactum]|uniref:Uncharacterized protein n=1 Tax=Streptomyces pactum TaxID=68249 RepID=A0A1S6J9R0_9ACTN|nr:hypothetical protein B1H29_17655 [Streptomyces pactum]
MISVNGLRRQHDTCFDERQDRQSSKRERSHGAGRRRRDRGRFLRTPPTQPVFDDGHYRAAVAAGSPGSRQGRRPRRRPARRPPSRPLTLGTLV